MNTIAANMNNFDRHDMSVIPAGVIRDLDRHVQRQGGSGDFLYAVLTNDLKGAIITGDNYHVQVIPHIVCYLYNNCPTGCWGSVEAVEAWLNPPE